ncbi:MAG TPA: DUF4139 domain-containing protein [Bacteroidales bacterium]|nr:DUF4139 domain-containing protein [Bacteroidales bacterium]
MKKNMLLILVSILFSSGIYAQKENIIKVSPDVNNVIIYLTGAQVRYKIQASLLPGRNLLEIKGLAPNLDPSSIRITADEKSTVLSVTHKKTSELVGSEAAKLDIVNDSIKLITKKINLINDEKNSLTIQKDLLLKNLSLGGQNTGVNFLDLQKASDYYQAKVFEINKRFSELTADADMQTATLAKLQLKSDKLMVTSKTQLSEVSVLIITENAQNTTLEFSYVVREAGWMPYYDLKCEDINKPLKLNYRAKAYNNCGIDWKDVALTLSTADPLLDINLPAIQTWYLYNYNGGQLKYDKGGYFQQNNANVSDLEYQNKEESKYQQHQAVQTKQIEVPELSFNFPIKSRYTLPSNAQPYIVDIDEYSLAASYRYVCVPVAEKSAFLLACISDWEELNLVEGNANIYLNGTYVGQSYLNPNEISDTLQVSLGRDSRIQVDRVKMKDYSSKVLIGSKRKATFVYEISVKNNRTTPIVVEIQDQVPVSSNQEIEVTIDQVSEAQHDIATGLLKWNFTIEPGKVQTVKLGYTVKYPKTVTLQFRKMKAINCPSF